MKKRKPSFFERLTGSAPVDDYSDFDDESFEDDRLSPPSRYVDERRPIERAPAAALEQPVEGDLSVDVMQTNDEVIIKAMVPGVKPDDLDVVITRDMVTIRGERHNDSTVADDNYYHRELYWGAVSRTIVLPAEVEPEEAQAYERHGLLELHLPKINREKSTKLKIKSQ